ncbi:MAG: MFS transporter [Chitinophagaceae bacterium]|nr:MFS transporter [Chitinophagaceae bacterium]
MRFLTRTVWILSLVSLLADIASEMLYPVIPVYLREIGFSVLLIGILEGVVNFTAGISKGYFGKRSDETGLRLPFVKLGYFLGALSKPMLAFFSQPVWVFFTRSLDRLGKGLRTAARDALLAGECSPENRGRVFGFHRGMDTVGAAIGPLAALVFLLFYPGQYTLLFYLAFLPGILSVALIFLLKEQRKPVSTLGKGSFFSFLRYWKIAGPEYRRIVPAFLVFALFNSSDIFLLLITRESIGEQTWTLWGKTLGADTLTIGAYVFYNLVYAASSFPAGILADKLGYKRVVLSGLLLFTLVYGGFAFQPGPVMILFLFFLYGLYAAFTEGVIKAWITRLAGGSNTATAIGFYSSGESIAALFASIIAGAVWTGFGSRFTFLLSAMVAAFVAVYLFLAGYSRKTVSRNPVS